MKLLRFTILLLPLLSYQIFPQFIVDWERVWNSSYSKNDKCTHIALDSNGDIILAGTSFTGTLIDYQDIMILKYSSDGNLIWEKRYDIGWSDAPIGLYTDGSNNIIAGIKGADSSIYTPSFKLLKLDPGGNEIFAKKFYLYRPDQSGNVTGRADKMHRDSYGHYVIAGPYWQLKMNGDGSKISSAAHAVNDTMNWNGYSSYLDPFQNEITAGVTSSYQYSTASYYSAVLKRSASGDLKWLTRLLVNTDGYRGYMNNYASNSSGENYYGFENQIWDPAKLRWRSDYHIYKIGTGGEKLWEKTLEIDTNALSWSAAYDFALDSGGNLIVTGTINRRFFAAKYSSAGERFLFIQDTDTTLMQGTKILADVNHKFFVMVWDLKGSVYLIKYDGLGNQLAKIKLQGLSEYFPLELNTIVFDESKNLILSGGKYLNGSYDFITYKISDITTEVEENESVQSMSFNLQQNYPNPFNPVTTIKYNIGAASMVKLAVYDIFGSEIKILIEEEQNPGSYSVNWNAAELASGVYFYRLNAGSFSHTKKLMLLK